MATTSGSPLADRRYRVASPDRRAEAAARGGASVGCGANPELLGAALVAALEHALLAAHRLLGALDSAAGRHADAAKHHEQVRMLLALVHPSALAGGSAHAKAGAPTGGIELPLPTHAPSARLSRREADVLGLLAAGRSNRNIAWALCLSPRTVQRHVANLYLKIGAHNKAKATAYAIAHGLR